MDLLYQRYASPFSFMDGMIQTGRFSEFVESLVKTVNEEREEKEQWEFWLHKVWDGTYEKFKEEIKNNKENLSMSKRTIETTIQNSMDILKNFNPQKEGGEK
jgi:hypothetical protein